MFFILRGGANRRPRAVSGPGYPSQIAAQIARYFIPLVLLASSPACADSGSELQSRTPAPAGRLAPPTQVRCERNQLTSYTGSVNAFERSPASIRIVIRTNWGSEETFTLPHPDGRPESHFLLWGKTFGPDDWQLIEQAPGQLIDDLQAIIWVCEDENIPPLIDWRPGSD